MRHPWAFIISLSFTFLFIAFWVTIIVADVRYDQQVGGYLKQAADANSTELAEQKVQQAIDGMEKRGLCNEGGANCYTSILYRTPDEDVGYWRKNIESVLADLQGMSAEQRADQLIESNKLIKVRETLIDNSGQYGDTVTTPSGIFLYPNNVAYALWGWLSGLFMCGSWITMLIIWFRG